MTQKELIVGFMMASNLQANDFEKKKLRELIEAVFAGANASEKTFKKLNEKLVKDLFENVYFAATLTQKWLTIKVFLDVFFKVANEKIETLAATLDYPKECENSGEAWRKHCRALFFGNLPAWAFYAAQNEQKGQK